MDYSIKNALLCFWNCLTTCVISILCTIVNAAVNFWVGSSRRPVSSIHSADSLTKTLSTRPYKTAVVRQRQSVQTGFSVLVRSTSDWWVTDITQKAKAIEQYRKGMKELENGIKIDIHGDGEEQGDFMTTWLTACSKQLNVYWRANEDIKCNTLQCWKWCWNVRW